MSERPVPNIGVDLQRIHRVITRGLAVAQENCQAFATGGYPDDSTAEGFWKYCLGLEAVINAHHTSEDDLFFPFLRDRMPGYDFDALTAEHEKMHGILGEMRVARESGSLADLDAALTKMSVLWQPHYQTEEAAFTPQVAAEVMTVPESIEMAQKAGAHAAEHAQPAPLAVPFVFYNLEGADREQMMATMPTEVTQQLVPVVWKDEWAPMKPFLLD